MNHYDTIVIGGGPTGMMAAISSSFYGQATLLLEKEPQTGGKTSWDWWRSVQCDQQWKPRRSPSRYSRETDVSSTVSFLNLTTMISSASSQKTGSSSRSKTMVVSLPASDRSQTIIQALTDKIAELGGQVRCQVEVTSVKKIDGQFVIKSKDETWMADRLIVTTGGKSYLRRVPPALATISPVTLSTLSRN